MAARGYYSSGGPTGWEDIPWNLVLWLTLVAIVVIALGYLALDSFYTVAPHERAVVLRFGKYRPPVVEPGLRFKIPLVDEVLKVSVEEHSLRLPFGTAVRPTARSDFESEEATLMLTGDLNAASVEWTIQWKVVDPPKFLFRFYHPRDPRYAEKVIRTVAVSVMNRLVGDYSIDEVLTEKRGEIAIAAKEATQAILDSYDCGVHIRDLQMQRVRPPLKVRPAFEEVNASIQRRDQLINEANKERNRLLPQALAEKDKLIREAEGYAKRIVAEAQGKIDGMLAQYAEYKLAPDETRRRLYIEAMTEVLAKAGQKIIVDADLREGMLPLLHLNTEEQR